MAATKRIKPNQRSEARIAAPMAAPVAKEPHFGCHKAQPKPKVYAAVTQIKAISESNSRSGMKRPKVPMNSKRALSPTTRP